MELYAWGANSYSQLGQGFKSEQIPKPCFVNFPGNPQDIVEIRGGGAFTLILTRQGKLFASGSNTKSQLATPTNSRDQLTFRPIDVSELFAHIFCGWESSAAISISGDLFVWGLNLLTSPKPTVYAAPVKFRLPSDEKVRSVSLGFHHICILTVTNDLYFHGRLRNFNQFPPEEGWTSVNWAGLSFQHFTSSDEIVQLASGQNHFVLSFRSGLMRCYGDNRFGQTSLHNGSIEGVEKLASGWTHNACLTRNGVVYTWGRNNYGQVGNGGEQSIVSVPHRLAIDEKIRELHCGSEHNLAVAHNGLLFTWGWNEHSNCGNGDTENLLKPVEISMPGRVSLAGTGAGFCFAVVERS